MRMFLRLTKTYGGVWYYSRYKNSARRPQDGASRARSLRRFRRTRVRNRGDRRAKKAALSGWRSTLKCLMPRYCKEGEKQGIVSAFRPRSEKRKKALMASGGCLKNRKRGKSFHVVPVTYIYISIRQNASLLSLLVFRARFMIPREKWVSQPISCKGHL